MFRLPIPFLVFFHYFKRLAVYAGDCHAHATYIHYQATVAVDAYDIAFNAGKVTGSEAEFDVAACIVFKGMEQETDTLRGCLHHAHERLHDAVGYDSGQVRATVVDKVMVGKVDIKIIL